MIGRASIGNPHIFKEFFNYYKYKTIPEKLTDTEKKIKQQELFLNYFEKIKNVDLFRKEKRIKLQANYFFKSLPNAKKIRSEIMKIKTTEEILSIVNKQNLYI